MSQTNLFTQLAGYSLNPQKRSIENFTTELLAHFFNDDVVFRRRFLAVIFADKRMARPFHLAQATTQESLSKDCRVDLMLRANSKVHLIEVKITASETQSGRWGQMGKPQVQRYLDLRKGHVTYLTTRASLAPDTDQRGRKYKLVKHALLEDLYQALRPARVSALAVVFLDFMNDNDMAGPEPFSGNQIKRAAKSMRMVKKCMGALSIVRSEANLQFRRNLKTYSNLTRPTYKGYADGGEVQCYLPDFHRKAVKWVGLSITPQDQQLHFCVWMWGRLDPSIIKIRDYLEWDEYDGAHGGSSSIRLYGTANDIPRMVEHAVKTSRQLGKAIRKIVK
jgi:hypothetical protein